MFTTKTMIKVSLIAAIYTILSLVLAPFSFGNIQVRVAEALTLLPLIYAPAIVGLTIGCFITNLVGVVMGANLLGMMDVVIGTSATLIAALITYKFKDVQIKNFAVISILSPIVINALIIGAELAYVLLPSLSGFAIFALDVAFGQAVSILIIGLPLLAWFKKTRLFD